MALKTKFIPDVEIAKMVTEAGFQGHARIVAVAIIFGESGGNAWAINMNTHDPEAVTYLSLDKGIVQWNDHWWDIAKGPDAFDPVKAINQMYTAYLQNTFGLWTAYKNHSFVIHVPRAIKAIEEFDQLP